jgi:hypothetical protein
MEILTVSPCYKKISDTQCPLCLKDQVSLKLIKPTKQRYWDCHECGLIFLDKEFLLSPDKEEEQYLTHNNDINDPRYQKFVSPIVNYISKHLPPGSEGLDFGAGPGPVISYLLKKMGFELSLFDPFFWNDPSLLNKTYNFIVACEVVEHFHSPVEEFHRFKSMLKDDGHLAIMTDLYEDSFGFEDWYYHRDPTHVVFYRMRTLEWIKDHFGFKDLVKAEGRAVVFKT